MKGKTVCALASVGMFLTSLGVYTVTPAGGWGAEAVAKVPDDRDDRWDDEDTDTDEEDADEDAARDGITRFDAGKALQVEARLGHSAIADRAGAETFILVDVKSGAEAVAARPRVHLAIVLDRSGSMTGQRMKNAHAAGVAAVQRLNDGDTVSVLAFDTSVQRVVAPISIDATSRDQVIRAIEGITLGGDTCISCGVEAALSDLAASSGTVDQVLLLSDGQANNGMVTLADFRTMGTRARNQGSSITTIGVDLQYNEETLGALSQESNGRHHFVKNEADLPAVFEKEAITLTGTVASDAMAVIDLAPGFELSRVVDRPFQRNGTRIEVPLGSFAQNESKTVLLAVRATSAAATGTSRLAGLEVRFRDVATSAAELGRADLTVGRSSSPTATLDPEVEARLQRTDTADALRRANEFFRKGEIDLARRTIKEEQNRLEATEKSAKGKAKPLELAPLDDDFKSQRDALGEAEEGFRADPFAGGGAPAGASPPPSPAPKTNVANELPLRL